MARRRFGNAAAETRAMLLDKAEEILRASGYAALTSRQLGKAAGLSPQIVYYYFKTMDELFAALFLRSADHYLQGVEEAKKAEKPMAALWKLSCDPSRAGLVQEFMALANHRKGLMALLSEFGRTFHAKQTEVIRQEIAVKRLDPGSLSPEVIAAILEVAARGFASGGGYDIPAH
ncbi:MAG: TetR/AcrR family transcriptional regulator, partial [Pseudomonas sp.]|uniref:TetR/AcrR family transcriptional regulator n=1 Tax=Pseudomonas sp. TaxID=306 RepID=UPI0011F9FD42